MTDDERPDDLLADVLDHDTAERWLHRDPDEEKEAAPEGQGQG